MAIGDGSRIARRVLPGVSAVVVLIDEGADLLLQVPAEWRCPADAQHRGARADSVVEQALIGAPVADYEPLLVMPSRKTLWMYQMFCHSVISKVASKWRQMLGKSMPTASAALPSR